MNGQRGLAVHETVGSHNTAAKRFSYGLVAQADAEQGYASRRGADEGNGDACFTWGTRTGRDHDGGRLQGQYLCHRQSVVAIDHRIGAQLTGVLDQVIGEAVVIVEDEEHALL